MKDDFYLKYITMTTLTHSFPMHPFSTPWKHQKTVRFSDVFREQRKGALGANGLNRNKLNDPKISRLFLSSSMLFFKKDDFLHLEEIFWKCAFKRLCFFLFLLIIPVCVPCTSCEHSFTTRKLNSTKMKIFFEVVIGL